MSAMLMNINSWCHPHIGTVVEVVEPLGGGALLSGGGLLVFVAWPHFQLELRFLRCDLSAFYSYCCAFPAIMDVWPAGTISKNKLLIAFGHGN